MNIYIYNNLQCYLSVNLHYRNTLGAGIFVHARAHTHTNGYAPTPTIVGYVQCCGHPNLLISSEWCMGGGGESCQHRPFREV